MNTLITFIGEHAPEILLWSIVLCSGAVVVSLLIMALQAWTHRDQASSPKAPGFKHRRIS